MTIIRKIAATDADAIHSAFDEHGTAIVTTYDAHDLADYTIIICRIDHLNEDDEPTGEHHFEVRDTSACEAADTLAAALAEALRWLANGVAYMEIDNRPRDVEAFETAAAWVRQALNALAD